MAVYQIRFTEKDLEHVAVMPTVAGIYVAHQSRPRNAYLAQVVFGSQTVLRMLGWHSVA